MSDAGTPAEGEAKGQTENGAEDGAGAPSGRGWRLPPDVVVMLAAVAVLLLACTVLVLRLR